MKQPSLRIACFVFGTTLCFGSTVMAGEWVSDPFNGCKIWNDDPVDGVATATWSGACTDGLASGEGLLSWSEQGRLVGQYRGGMRAGKLFGQGVVEAISESGIDRLAAEFLDGLANGPGIFDGAAGERYVGTFEGGERSGIGFYTEPSGAFYDGEFADGLPHGHGRARSEAGDEFIGFFAKGQRDGDGIELQPNGELFAGQYADGLPSGFGRYEDSAGGIYVGTFQNGVPNGPGSYIAPDGTVYQGNFRERQPDGEVLVTASDGSQTVETWENGGPVQ